MRFPLRAACPLVAILALTSRVAAGATDSSPASIAGPRDLPYYSVKWAQNLSLEDMHARVVARDSAAGYDILQVEFDAFDQPIVGPARVQTVRWRQRAALVLPPRPLQTAKALAFNVHDLELGDQTRPHSYVGTSLAIAQAFGIPVMVHGWAPDVVKEVEGKSFHDTQEQVMRRLLAARIESARDLPMDGRYLFNGNPLVKADMVALTLLQRLVKRERGIEVTQLASQGGSKEGLAHWLLGALDDRVAVLAPGGLYWHDSGQLLDRYRKDWNWHMPWKDSDQPEYAGLRSLFETAWKLCDWIETTEAGQLAARTTTDPVRWYPDIRAKHVLIFGDLGITPGQHDGPWPFWAENAPLAKFKHPSSRYLRIFDGDGGLTYEHTIGEMGLSLLPHVADLLVNDAVLPSTPTVELTDVGGRQARVRSTVTFTPGLDHEMVLLYAMSPERGLRDREYWHFDRLRETAPGTWERVLPAVPQGQGLAVMVVARERVSRGSLSFWRSASALPAELFPVAEFNAPGPDWRD